MFFVVGGDQVDWVYPILTKNNANERYIEQSKWSDSYFFIFLYLLNVIWISFNYYFHHPTRFYVQHTHKERKRERKKKKINWILQEILSILDVDVVAVWAIEN